MIFSSSQKCYVLVINENIAGGIGTVVVLMIMMNLIKYHILSSMSSGFRRVQVHLWVWPCCLDPNEQQFVHARHQGGRDDDGNVVSVQIRGFFQVLNNEYVQKKKNSNFWRSPLPYCKHYQPNHKHSTASQHWRWKKTARFPRKQSPTSQIHTRSQRSSHCVWSKTNKHVLILSDPKISPKISPSSQNSPWSSWPSSFITWIIPNQDTLLLLDLMRQKKMKEGQEKRVEEYTSVGQYWIYS